MNRWTRAALFALLLAAAVVLYARHLGDAPVYMSPDEVIIAVDAHSVATTGRDVHGAFMPLYFQDPDAREDAIGLVHARHLLCDCRRAESAAAVGGERAAAVASSSALDRHHSDLLRRPPDVHVAIAGARRSGDAGADAGALHPQPLRARLSLSGAVSARLAAVCAHVPRAPDGRGRCSPATLLLGIGFYSYIAAVLMAPVYLPFTAALLFYARKPARDYASCRCWLCAAAAAVRAVAGCASDGVRGHGQSLRALQHRQHGRAPGAAIVRQLQQPRGTHAAIYWSFLNPSFLFFTGDAQMPFSTRAVGVFLLPVAALMVAGICVGDPPARAGGASRRLFGFFTAPLAAVLVPENSEIIRAGGVAAVRRAAGDLGVEALWHGRWSTGACSLVMPLGLVDVARRPRVRRLEPRGARASRRAPLARSSAPVSRCASSRLRRTRSASRRSRRSVCCWRCRFSSRGFYRDYFGDYRRRSSNWLGGNLRGALVDLVERDQASDDAPYIYFAQLRSTSGIGRHAKPVDGDVLDVLSDQARPPRSAPDACATVRSGPRSPDAGAEPRAREHRRSERGHAGA